MARIKSLCNPRHPRLENSPSSSCNPAQCLRIFAFFVFFAVYFLRGSANVDKRSGLDGNPHQGLEGDLTAKNAEIAKNSGSDGAHFLRFFAFFAFFAVHFLGCSTDWHGLARTQRMNSDGR